MDLAASMQQPLFLFPVQSLHFLLFLVWLPRRLLDKMGRIGGESKTEHEPDSIATRPGKEETAGSTGHGDSEPCFRLP